MPGRKQQQQQLQQQQQQQQQLQQLQRHYRKERYSSLTRKSLANEREDVQKKTFAKWINSQLAKGQHPPVTDLFYDLRDGTRLLALLEVLTGRTYKREKGRMRVHHLNNVSRALAVLEENSVKLVNISNEHIVDGSAKLTLGLVWAVILHWQVQGVLKDVMSDLQQTNLEKTLLAWCRQTTKGYHGVDVRNFTTCWSDGLAFNALIHSHRPQLFEWSVVARKHPFARLENAFRLANEHLGIERLLDPEDINSQVPDKKSIMMYVMCLFQALPHDSFTVENLDASMGLEAAALTPEGYSLGAELSPGKGRPLSTASIGLSGYQRTLEEVLTWLLGAEDRLAAMPPIADSTDAVKEQFHDLEELMLDLTSKQGGIGDVLGEGSRLLREGVMEDEEEEEVRVQMKLLNTRWEELRVRAMDRQSRLHERLMCLQEKQLEGLKKWLTETEDRIANMSQVGPTTEALRDQVEAHQQLQHDLEAEQSNINSLSNMVVVVDETNSDSVYSSLEDELNALGERWAHICRWTESRWSTLQTLSMHWPRFEEELMHLKEWLEVKERMLRQFESEPATEESQVLRHASSLQVLEAEMEAQQQRFDVLQELSSKILIHIPEDSPAHGTVPTQLEDVQDRLDLLTSIVEAQTSRLAASGIDIHKVTAPVEGGGGATGGAGEVVRSSTTTITSKDATTTLITKVVTTKVTEVVSGSAVKRQKLEGGSQEDFTVALTKLGEWMEGVEGKAESGEVDQLSLHQLSLLHQQLQMEMESQQEEYSKVVSLGQSLISETSTIGESSSESERLVQGVKERWGALTRMLEEIRCRTSFLTAREEVTATLRDLQKKVEEEERWMEEEKKKKKKKEEYKSKVEEVERVKAQVEGLRGKVEGLEGRWVEEKLSLLQMVEESLGRWRKLEERLQKALKEDEEALQEESMEVTASPQLETAPLPQPPQPTPPQDATQPLLKAVTSSREWLKGLEAALGSGKGGVLRNLPVMENRLAELKELQQKVECERPTLDDITSTSTTLSADGGCEGLQEDVRGLNEQWRVTTHTLVERIEATEKALKQFRQYEDEVSGLKSWLAEVEVFLKAEEAALGDIDTLEAQLEQSNALQDDISTLRTNMESITTTGTQLVEEARVEVEGSGGVVEEEEGAEFSTTLKRELEELRQRWEDVTQLAILQNRSLKEALARSQKVHKDIHDLTSWLDDLEKRIPPPPQPPATATSTFTTPEDLTAAAATLQALKEEVTARRPDLNALNNIGDEMLQADSSSTHEDLARQLTQLNGRWSEVSARIDSQCERLSEAVQQYGDFTKLCQEEEEWLTQLQNKLEGSCKDAADAEEISEALDELDIFLHSHDEGRLDRIRQLGEALGGEGCLAERVRQTTTTLTTRFHALNTQASERQSGLEGRIQEAQAWEREYVSVLEYLTQTDATLTQAYTGEVMLGDLVQVQSELSSQKSVLEKMKEQVEVYRREGKGEAAVRLEDQVTHLQHKYDEAEMKLQMCQKPSEYEGRLQRTEAQLQEIGRNVEQLHVTSGSPDAIQEQLTQCMSLYQTLSEVKGEVEEVIATGRRMVKDGQCSDPTDLTSKLDRVKALYNQLGGAVTEHRGTLERALRHTRKMTKECQQLEEWLSSTEAELDQREASVPTKNLQAEVHFVQHALEDLSRRKPLLVGVQEGLVTLSKEPGHLPTLEERVADLTHTWERVTTRLSNRLVNMQSEQAGKEAEMESFIVGLGEVKGWLESTETQLATLHNLPPQDQERLVKAVSSEAQQYKGQIEDIRGTSQALISHGVLFQARVQPEIELINERWENIYQTLQKQEEMSVSKTYVRESRTTTTTSTTTTTAPPLAKEEEEKDKVEEYLQEVSRISDKVTALTAKTHTLPPYQIARHRLEALEEEVSSLEPDVATVISRGDTLTLTTHMVDIQRAHNIRVAVNDLRTQWTALKTRCEAQKVEVEKVSAEIQTVSGRANDIISWCNEAVKRLHLVNNDESQLEALEAEMTQKKEELDALNESGALLKRYQYSQIQPVLTLLNMRWTEISMQFRQYRKGSLEKKSVVEETTTITTTTTTTSAAPPPPSSPSSAALVTNISRLRDAIEVTAKQLGGARLTSTPPYHDLKLQEEELKVVKDSLATLKPQVDGVEEEREALLRQGGQAVEEEMVRRSGDKLREEWAQVNRGHTERHTRWLQCSETWITLHKTVDEFAVWLGGAEERIKATGKETLPEAKATQKELEKQVTLKHRPSQTVQTLTKEVVEGLPHEEGRKLQEKVDALLKRWKALLVDLAARRERIAGEEGVKEGMKETAAAPPITSGLIGLGSGAGEYEALVTWVDQVEALMAAPVNVTDEASLSAHSTMVQNHVQEVSAKQGVMRRMKEGKVRGVTPVHLTPLDARLTKVAQTLPEYRNKVETKLGVIKTLCQEVEDIYRWTEEMRVKVALRTLTQEEVRAARGVLREKEALFENLDSTFWVLAQDVEAKGLEVSLPLKNRVSTIEARLKTLQSQLSDAPPHPIAPQAEEEGGEGAAPPVGSTVTANVTSVIKNVIRLEETVLREGQEVRPPSPLVSPPRHPPDSSPVLILASLDKSILQIRDWLTLMEQMSRQQTVEVGDEAEIRRLTEKQKNVLRELEGKKPQLDDLVSSADGLKEDASRAQLHQKVSKLREHWDETNSVVLARKTQLDAMLSDTHKFDAKRAELEAWLGRMEARLERMAPVARTADVLDQQIREQKGFHAEIHQYKHQLELFNQMTQRLIAVYQHDDTRRLKKITESVNFRYSSLNTSIIARGKELHSAINSLHNFDKALDKFASWMSEMESGSEAIEGEVDKLGPPPPTRGHHHPLHHHPRTGPSLHLKDLQSEIENHKDVLASLNATGQKLLGTLENQEEAVMLQRRLEEMNHRWNTLKHKSIAIRNRLEGNTENWTTLLLSLRELIEWVIRKDTELTALGPLVGDLVSLSKYSEDIAAFRKVIEEKQPVIESNLKSGRQLIASEPPLSDTSDSEAGRELDGDARYRGDETARDLTRAVRREVAKLSEKWAALRERVAALTTHTELALKKLGVLQRTVEEVSARVEEAERVVDGWGGVPQDPNLADQHAHNVKKFREGLVELQRGVDDVNDQAARFSAHSVPLTPANSAKLHDLNSRWKNLETVVNDRWRQVAGRSREVTPLTPAQLASSVSPPWERATTTNKVPYYINHDQENTHWDHPIMMDILDSLTEFNHIKFSAYRTATKLRVLQKKLALDKAKMQTATDIFDEHGLRGQNDRLIDVGDMVVVLSALYGTISADHPDVDTTLAMDLCLNWLLNVYDSQRTGQMRVLSFKIGLVCLCTGHLEEKYRYMFRLIADPNRLVDQRKLGLLLHDCVQVPRQLGEVAAFGGSNIEPSVRSCFTKAGKDRETIEAVHFLAWVQQEPQSLVWLAVLHRVAASESIQHQVKCNICKAYPILGLRYRCLKCLSFDMCQDCFFDGRSGKSHKITHPMHEYCTATTAGEDVKDFTKALKNKFKSKRSLQKHTKKGYLPVQTVLEGDPLESPSPSPQHNVTSQDMHSRLEMYASRLAEVELRTNSNSTPDSEDEHGLIAQYCQSLSSSDAPLPVPRSPLQIMAAVDADQKDELEQMIRALEEENSELQKEYDRLKSQQPVGSPPEDGLGGPQRSEAEMLAEAKLLRQHKGRLEARMGILEEHNRQLEAQLHRLRQLLGETGGLSSPSKSGTLQTKSVTASQLAMDSPAKINGHSTQGGGGGGLTGSSSAYDGLDQLSEYVRPPPPPLGSVAHVGNLLSRAGDLGKAVGTLVAAMNQEQGNDLPSEEEEEEGGQEKEEKQHSTPTPTPTPRQKQEEKNV